MATNASNMKIQFKYIFIFFPLFISITTCKKGLTKATQNGANTFSCKINGNIFEPCPKIGVPDPSLYGGLSITSIIIARVTADCYSGTPQKSVAIELSHFNGIGNYSLTDSNYVCTYIEYGPGVSVKIYKSINGTVTITKDDRTNYILSGTFEFTAENTNDVNDAVTVNDGRFDLSYK
ncbi:MAG: DUF6252 family protein [Chitinophagaceae bacterium]